MEQKGIFEKPMIKWGLFLGGVNVLYILLLYIMDVSLLVSFWNSLVSLVLSVVFMILACREERTNNGGTLMYGNAVVLGIGVGVIASILGVAFNGILYNVIDPTLAETMKELTIEKTASMMEGFGASEADIEKALENMDTRAFEQNFRSMATALMVSALFSAFLALIVGAFMKRTPDIFEETTDAGA
jgi:hypothetical protein